MYETKAYSQDVLTEAIYEATKVNHYRETVIEIESDYDCPELLVAICESEKFADLINSIADSTKLEE